MIRPSTSDERMAVLHRIAGDLATHVDRARLYEGVVAGARELVGGSFAVALSWDEARRALVVEAVSSDGVEVRELSPAELAICAGPAFAARATLHLDDLEELPRAASLARRLGLGSGAALPIPGRGDGPPVGALCVAVPRGAPPLGQADVRAVELWALHAGAALTHAEGLAGSVRRVARLEQLTVALRSISEARERDLILERGLDCALGVLGADRAAVYLTNGREELWALAARGLSRAYLEFAGQRYRQSAGGLVPMARVPVYVADLQTDPRTRILHEVAAQEGVRSVLFVPMLRGGRLQGAVALYHDLVWPYAPEDIAHARALADEVAIALVNAGLAESSQREIARVRALERTAHALLEGAGPRRALQALVDDGVAWAAWLWNPAMAAMDETGPASPGSDDALAVARAALDGGRVVTRTAPWGVVAATPVRHGGQIVGVLAVAERRRARIEPPPPSLYLTISDEIDVAEPVALATAAAHHLGAAIGRLAGREPQARASGGKP